MKRILSATILSISAIAPAVAADFYAGIKLGSANHKIDSSGYTETVSAGSIFAGYSINKNVAFEIEAINTGKLGTDTSNPLKTGGMSLSVVGSYPVSTEISLLGKLGVANIKEEDNTHSQDRSGITVGLGGQYDINQSVGLRLTWDNYTYGGTNNWYEGKVNMYSIGALYKF